MFFAGSDRSVVPGVARVRSEPHPNEALKSCNVANGAMRYIRYPIVSKLHSMMENSHLYKLKDMEQIDWPEAIKCQLETGSLPLVFAQIL